MKKIIGQGAEATITLEKNDNKEDVIIKKRSEKAYRHKTIDKNLRESRSRKEKKVLLTAKNIVRVPEIHYGDNDLIVMEHIKGPAIKEILEKNLTLAETIGENVAQLHDKNIIHADLTTSNILFDEEKKEVVFIDFGLAYTSKKDEDKAVDIHLFKQALESKHHIIHDKAYKQFLKGYKKSKNSQTVLQRLEQVEKRGRHKQK